MISKISKVLKESIAEELNIEKGDRLISINNTPVKDIIDYKFLMADEYVDIEIEKHNGEIWNLEIEKDYDEKLGVEFEEAIMDKPKSCHNKCVFCFIDQLPKGMRKTLYFKDDDSRLAFLQGNFVTLTNMSDDEINRIIRYKISPINVSVHTTNPELRVKLTNNRFAGNVYERLKRMAEAGISINCQVVLCPELNDGEELKRTIEDLYKLYPQVANLAVVPVGITKYREGLYKLKLFNKHSALKQIQSVEKLQEKYISESGTPFVRLSDEFYVLAGKDVPDTEFYDGFKQIEDGVGMIRMFRECIDRDIHSLDKNAKGSFTIVTGVSAYSEIVNAANKIMEYNSNIKINVKKIINNFFGETITVAGLITGKDIMEQLEHTETFHNIIMPNNMLRKGYELGDYSKQVLLDDVTIEKLEEALKAKILICDFTGEDLIDIINQNC